MRPGGLYPRAWAGDSMSGEAGTVPLPARAVKIAPAPRREAVPLVGGRDGGLLPHSRIAADGHRSWRNGRATCSMGTTDAKRAVQPSVPGETDGEPAL